MQRFFNYWVCGLLLAIAAIGLAGCAKPPQQAAAAAPPPPKPAEVFVNLPTKGEITDFEDFTGRTVANKTIDLRARVTGYLDKINFKEKEGRRVEQGDVLFEIDPRPYEAEVLRHNASVHQAESHLKRVQLDYERAEKLVGSKSISREQYDLATGERNEALATIEVMKADLALAKLNLRFTKVLAPLSGQVSRTQLDAGNLVKADDTILTTIVATDPIYAYFEVDERTMLRMRRFADQGRIDGNGAEAFPIMMGLADEEGFPHKGTINFVENRLDPATGTLQVRGIFPNSDSMLSPGLFVRVRLPIGQPYEALLVSEESLGTDQGQKFVYVVDKDNVAQYRRVQIGKLQQGRRVVLKGIEEGERIVVSGLQRVRPGAVVAPKMVEATAQQDSKSGSDVKETSTASKELSQK